MARGPLACGGSVLRGMSVIYRSEGLWQGLFKGMSATWLKGPITVAIPRPCTGDTMHSLNFIFQKVMSALLFKNAPPTLVSRKKL